jgi:outer membrane immunogenic protein
MNSFKTALLGATFLVGAVAASGANAADVYGRGSIKDTGPVDYMPAITWTGFYFGAQLGAAFLDGEDGDDDTVAQGGLHAGFNWEKPGGFVLGIEGDVDFADDIEYLATLRGRLGLARGATLFYATGGVAFLGVDEELGDDDDSLTGWTAGLGVEHKFRENVSLGLEGLYYNFEEETDSDDADFWAVRARLTYHLGGSREALK